MAYFLNSLLMLASKALFKDTYQMHCLQFAAVIINVTIRAELGDSLYSTSRMNNTVNHEVGIFLFVVTSWY